MTTQAFRYAMRPADPLHRREHPGATEVVQIFHGKQRRVMGVYRTPDAAQKVACDLDESAGDQLA